MQLPVLTRAVLPAVPVVNRLPGLRRDGTELPALVFTGHIGRIDRAHLTAYSRICGYSLADSVPMTYPHLLAFPLHMAVLTDRSFPFPAVGTVHLANVATRHREISPDEQLQVTVRPAGLRPHPKGAAFDLLTHVHSADGELVWESSSTFLRRGAPAVGTPREDDGRPIEEVRTCDVKWRLPADLGRRYAAVSGDHNPIHLYALTAKAFGFPRQIAHGMWSKARCVAALSGRVPDRVTAEVAFSRPVLLPGTVAFGSAKVADGYAFALRRPHDGAAHLVGRVTAE